MKSDTVSIPTSRRDAPSHSGAARTPFSSSAKNAFFTYEEDARTLTLVEQSVRAERQ